MLAQHKITGTFNNGRSGYYIVRLATLKLDPAKISSFPTDEVSIDVWCKRQSAVGGKFETESKDFRASRTGHYRFSRLTKDLSGWLDSQETPLDAKVDALLLLKTAYRLSRCFKSLKRLTLILEMGVTPESEEETEGDGRECTICLEGFWVGPHSRAMEMPCSHAFHGHCIAGWLRKQATCPLCRFELEKNQIEDIRASYTN